MSEQINVKEFPHIFMLKKYNLSKEKLSNHTKQLMTDFNRVVRLVASRSKDGNVSLTAATQNKLETYDRYICEGIFEYLEDEEKLSDAQSTKEEEQMEKKREEVVEKMEEIEEKQKEEIAQEAADDTQKSARESERAPEEAPAATPPQEEIKDPKTKTFGMGFWDWK